MNVNPNSSKEIPNHKKLMLIPHINLFTVSPNITSVITAEKISHVSSLTILTFINFQQTTITRPKKNHQIIQNTRKDDF